MSFPPTFLFSRMQLWQLSTWLYWLAWTQVWSLYDYRRWAGQCFQDLWQGLLCLDFKWGRECTCAQDRCQQSSAWVALRTRVARLMRSSSKMSFASWGSPWIPCSRWEKLGTLCRWMVQVVTSCRLRIFQCNKVVVLCDTDTCNSGWGFAGWKFECQRHR